MVEAKEKALEIFNEHYFYLRANLMYDEEAKEDALECALITVNRIWNLMYDAGNKPEFTKGHWQEVRQELENMRDKNALQIIH
jgi:hypothetical protein